MVLASGHKYPVSTVRQAGSFASGKAIYRMWHTLLKRDRSKVSIAFLLFMFYMDIKLTVSVFIIGSAIDKKKS